MATLKTQQNLVANKKNSTIQKKYSVILRYLDIKNKNVITETSLSSFYDRWINPRRNHLSFSPNGSKIMIQCHDKYIILPVPFEAIYQPEVKNKAILAYWLFKKYELPYDIILIPLHNIIESSKR